MKTAYLKMLLLCTAAAIATSGRAQALLVKACVKNEDDQKIAAYYTLSNSYELLQAGKCSSLKLKLGYNDCYTLTFSKRGCRSKTVRISTFDNGMHRRYVLLNVTLSPLTVSDMQEPEQVAGGIYYDRSLQDYRYIRYCDKTRSRPVQCKRSLYASK